MTKGFALGRIVATPGAFEAATRPYLTACLRRHARGDWGCLDPEDQRTNDDAVRYGNRILSAYPLDPMKPCEGWGENTLWVITEADRSATTFLLPDEY